MSMTVCAQTKRYLGGDVSMLPSYEQQGTVYKDFEGKQVKLLPFLKRQGWNMIRVRLFVDPQNAPEGHKGQGVCQDLNYVIGLCRQIKKTGMQVMLDFHYSDTWADPSNQWTPQAWQSLNDEQLKQKVYGYTRECLTALVEAGATPDFIQTGNEISYGMLWGKYAPQANDNRCYSNSPQANWTRFVSLLQQAVKACREVCPQAKIVIHTERSGDATALKNIHNRLSAVDYDVIGLSYYPFWHGGLEKLSQSLNMLAQDFPDKAVQIVETAYYYQWQPKNGITDFSSTWPVSVEGQAAFARSLVAELKKHPNVNGLYWWFPEENGNGPGNKVLAGWVNRGLWGDESHRAHPGLYVLKDFLSREGTAVGDVEAADASQTVGIYNLKGQRLRVPPAHGLYIQNGYLRVSPSTAACL